MLNRRLIGMLALLLSAGLTFTACGDDDPANGDKKNNNQGEADAKEDNDTGDAGTKDTTTGGDTKTDEDATQSGCTAEEGCSEGYTCDTATHVCVALPTGCDLTGADRPARCDETIGEDNQFGPASLVTAFGIADQTCCFNLDGDEEGENDNKLSMLTGIPNLDVNGGIQDSIDSRSLVLIFEHDGLEDLSSSEPYTLNVWLGESFEPEDLETGLLIDPASIDQGTYPQASLPNAKIENGVLTAGPGLVDVNLALEGILDAPIGLRISSARIEAIVDTAASSIEDGIVIKNAEPALRDGKLGGAVRVDDLVNAFNTITEPCTCFGLEGNLIDYDPSNPSAKPALNDISGNTCTETDPSICQSLAENSGMIGTFVTLLPTLTDIDTDGDGTRDAISIGATFNTTGVKIKGFAETPAP